VLALDTLEGYVAGGLAGPMWRLPGGRSAKTADPGASLIHAG
jgi:hypothetical protein